MKSLVFKLTLAGLVTFSGSVALAQAIDFQMPAEAKPGEVTQDVRDVEVAKQLKGTTNTVLVYAEGMCCPSCSSGVKKYVGELAFVKETEDRSSVQIDAKHQLVRIEIKPRSTIDMQALSKRWMKRLPRHSPLRTEKRQGGNAGICQRFKELMVAPQLTEKKGASWAPFLFLF